VALLGAVGAAQNTTFQSRSDLVALYVTVTDEKGRGISGLSKDDFALVDRGRPQEIAVFSREPQPASIVVMLDYSGSMQPHKRAIREAAESLVDRLLPVDRARVGAFNFDVASRSPRILLDPELFTSDGERLIGALRAQYDTIGDGASPIWRAVDRSLDALAGETNRRVLVLLSDGHDTDGHGYVVAGGSGALALTDAGPGVPVTFDAVLRRIQASDVLMYTLGFSRRAGRTPPTPSSMRAENMPGIADTHGRIEPHTVQSSIDQTLARAEPPPVRVEISGTTRGEGLSGTILPDPSLKTLADMSGGRYFDVGGSSDFKRMFTEVIDELHGQYLVGFVPAVLDGATHTLEVTVRIPGATVRARKSYVADKK
jgi:VWFA-related protein